MVPRLHVSFYSFGHPIITEKAKRKLNDSLGEHVDLEGLPHDSRE